MDFIHRFRNPLVVFGLLLVTVLLFVSNSKNSRDHNTLDRAVLWLSSPIQWSVVHALDGISSGWNGYIALVDAEEENRELRLTNAQLEHELALTREEHLENVRLKKLLELRDYSPDDFTRTARIIAHSPSPLFRSVRIDVGVDDGVRVGAAIMTYAGVVGRVAAVGGGWADVMLMVDSNASTDVLVQRTRDRARIRGRGGDVELGIDIENLARTAKVEPGDMLITSGAGRVFPKGIRVGRVVAVERGAFGLYQSATIEPSVDFARLEEVQVLLTGWEEGTSYEATPVGGARQRKAAATAFADDTAAPKGEAHAHVPPRNDLVVAP